MRQAQNLYKEFHSKYDDIRDECQLTTIYQRDGMDYIHFRNEDLNFDLLCEGYPDDHHLRVDDEEKFNNAEAYERFRDWGWSNLDLDACQADKARTEE